MEFAETPRVSQDWTNNLDALEAGINRLRPGGGTALFDAIFTAAAKSCSVSAARSQCAKAIVLLSDGDDDQSRVHPDRPSRCASGPRPSLRHQHQLDAKPRKGDQVLTQMARRPADRFFSRLRSKRCRKASTTSRKSCAASML